MSAIRGTNESIRRRRFAGPHPLFQTFSKYLYIRLLQKINHVRHAVWNHGAIGAQTTPYEPRVRRCLAVSVTYQKEVNSPGIRSRNVTGSRAIIRFAYQTHVAFPPVSSVNVAIEQHLLDKSALLAKIANAVADRKLQHSSNMASQRPSQKEKWAHRGRSTGDWLNG